MDHDAKGPHGQKRRRRDRRALHVTPEELDKLLREEDD
jgi:hypothetical protein